MEVDWSGVVLLATYLVSLIGGVGVVPIVKYIKSLLNLNPRFVQLVTVVVCVLMGSLVLIANGVLVPKPLTPNSVVEVFTLVLVASQAEYQRTKRQELEK